MCPDEHGIMSVKLSKDIDLESCEVTVDQPVSFEFPMRGSIREAPLITEVYCVQNFDMIKRIVRKDLLH